MRDPARIDGVLAELRKAWLQQPDMRLGQLLIAAARTADLFNIEDQVLARLLAENDPENEPAEEPDDEFSPAASNAGRLHAIVLRSKKLKQTKAFYAALGLPFQREQHDGGPEHFACEQHGMVFELYPAKPNEKLERVRLGIEVTQLEEAMIAAIEAGGTLLAKSCDVLWARQIQLQDPDGRTVDVRQKKGR